jgi:hypothetical protein
MCLKSHFRAFQKLEAHLIVTHRKTLQSPPRTLLTYPHPFINKQKENKERMRKRKKREKKTMHEVLLYTYSRYSGENR